MIMIRLMGGLGNQMFQYAFGRALSIKYNRELILDQTLLLDKSSEHSISTHRDYDLDIFKNLKFRWATSDEVFAFNGDEKAGIIKKITRKITNTILQKKLIVQQNNSISQNYFEIKGDTCFVGRWQSYLFFTDYTAEILNDFQVPKPPIKGLDLSLEHIKSQNSVCLHVRRGDLITSPLYSKTIGALDGNYYLSAIEHINRTVKDPVYFVFSEDIEWCKHNINPGKPTVFVESFLSGKKGEGHFYLMQNCKHFIISNSTYAWWAAFLSSAVDKIIIYPASWFKEKTLSNPEMCPPNWLAL